MNDLETRFAEKFKDELKDWRTGPFAYGGYPEKILEFLSQELQRERDRAHRLVKEYRDQHRTYSVEWEELNDLLTSLSQD